MSIQAMKQALEALGYGYDAARCTAAVETIRNAESALRAAITEAERQEPVAEVTCFGHDADIHPMITYNARLMCNFEAGNYHLYTTPQPAIPEGWISVSERLPDHRNECLVYSRHIEDGCVIKQSHLNPAKTGFYREYSDDGETPLEEITHWMPLPAAPKPENSHD